MPIDGRTLGEAARTFRNHLNEVLARTVTQSRMVLLGPTESEGVQVAFRERGGPAAAPLRTVSFVRIIPPGVFRNIPPPQGAPVFSVYGITVISTRPFSPSS